MGRTTIADVAPAAFAKTLARFVMKDDDRAGFNTAARRFGVVQAARLVTQRDAPQGERFNYSGAQTEVLGLVPPAPTASPAIPRPALSIGQTRLSATPAVDFKRSSSFGAISSSGSTSCAAPAAMASRGMPKTTQLASSCT